MEVLRESVAPNSDACPAVSPMVAAVLAELPSDYATSPEALRKVEAAEKILRELRSGEQAAKAGADASTNQRPSSEHA